jgi:hypothetical protein
VGAIVGENGTHGVAIVLSLPVGRVSATGGLRMWCRGLSGPQLDQPLASLQDVGAGLGRRRDYRVTRSRRGLFFCWWCAVIADSMSAYIARIPLRQLSSS